MTFQTQAEIVSNREVAKDIFSCVLKAAQIERHARPGQFLTIRVSDFYLPLLRRPFSIHRAGAGRVEVLYEVLGEGTAMLSKRKSGERLDVIGPLGRGYDCLAPEPLVLVAGGMGVAPLVFLAQRLVYKRKARPTVLIGGKTKAKILCEREFRRLGCRVMLATDDGSRGFKGRVCDLLERVLSGVQRKAQVSIYACGPRPTIYACGPRPMLEAVARLAVRKQIAAQVSLEEHMACGIGACLGCAVKTRRGLERVCKDGPVFAAEDILW